VSAWRGLVDLVRVLPQQRGRGRAGGMTVVVLRTCAGCGQKKFVARRARHRFCSKRCWLSDCARGAVVPPDVERVIRPLPYRGVVPSNGSRPVRACVIHHRALRENPITDELVCPKGRHPVDEWLVTIAGQVLAQADRFGLVAVAPCLHPGALRDFMPRAQHDAAEPREHDRARPDLRGVPASSLRPLVGG
jgi:hypothetical protein